MIWKQKIGESQAKASGYPKDDCRAASNPWGSTRRGGKLLLINPPLSHPEAVVPPLGLAYLAAVLEQDGVNTAVLDANALGLDREAIVRQVELARPDAVGITVMYSSYPAARSLTKALRGLPEPPLIIWGGPHPTICPEPSLNEGGADVCVLGEGEQTIRELVPHLGDGPRAWNAIPGLAFREGELARRSPPRPLLAELDSLPFPARHLLPLARYRTLQTRKARFTTVITSRGCPGKCMFCSRRVFGRTMRYRSVDNVMAEIEELARRYSIRTIAFIDDAFLQDRERVMRLCRRLLASGLKLSWRLGNGVRVDQVDAELLRQMRSAGCTELAFGVESGDDAVLKRIGKEITTEQVRRAFRLAHAAGLQTIGFFQLGHPFDTVETMGKTIEFALELDPGYASFAVSTPLPGTALWEWVRRHGKPVSPPSRHRLDIFSPTPHFETDRFTSEEVSGLYRTAYRRFYLRPSYLRRRLFSLRSWKDLTASFFGWLYLQRISRRGLEPGG